MGREFTLNGTYKLMDGGTHGAIQLHQIHKTQSGVRGYCQETLQNKNIHKYKLQMIYFRNYTGTPIHLLAQFLQIP